ncbi:unnamed protein product [Schistocephalus solidus]|uniref:Uncharacterized protein n=1 Tax=Schistocephalus solidus TaxID=70667 RepID=A0A3P7CKN1_SCHSO|nr:unnamed protein product [Schistocephalus solidus]
MTGELAEVRTEFEKAKADFEREMTLLREETKTALEEQKKRLYEEREEQLRAFEAERTKWNEERAEMLIEQAKSMASHFESKDRDSTINSEFQKEIYRQITEVQNQANARVAQLQTQIDLLTALPPSSTAVVTALKRPLPGARPTTARSAAADVGPKEPPRWPAPITPRPGLPRPAFGSPRTVPPKCVRPVGVISLSNVPSASCTRLPGGGGGFTSRGQTPAAAAAASASVSIPSPAALCPRAVTPGLPRRTAPVAPIAAVPPVLVVSSAVTHPLLSNADLSDAPEGHTEAPTKAAVKLPNSTWKKASELESGNYTSSDYFKLHSVEAPDMDEIFLRGMVGVDCLGFRFKIDALTHLKFGVKLKATTSPQGCLQPADGLDGFGDPISHPYYCPVRNQQHPQETNYTDSVENPSGTEHPAFHTGASTVPVQLDMSFPVVRWDQDSLCRGKTQARSPVRFQPPSAIQRSSGASSASSSPTAPSNASVSHPRSYSHGQAEQLRRSRESTTFALIDNQLSKPPLNQVRDMYLQNRGGSSSSSSTPTRTTKKANLSAVHTVVRFRIREYLLPMIGHMRKMLDILFSSQYPDYNSSVRDVLASQLFGQTQLPCSLSCEFCERFRYQLDRQTPSRKLVFSKTLMPTKPTPSDKTFATMSAPESGVSRAPSPDQNYSTHGLTDVQIKPEASSETTPLSSPSSPLLNFDILEPASEADLLEELLDVVDEVHSLPTSQHPLDEVNLPDIKRSPSRIRLDSVSAQLQEGFDLESMYWPSDFDVCPEESVELQNLILGSSVDVKLESLADDASTLPALYDLESLTKTPFSDYASLDSNVSVKKEPFSLQFPPPMSCDSSSSSCESQQHY